MDHSSLEISGPFSALIIGLILGLRHSTDADHVVAVSTIARNYKSVVQGLWVGVSWGIGHSTPLIIVGIIVLLLKESFIDFYEDNLTEDNVDEIVNMLEEMFPADVLLCLISQGYFIAPTQAN